MVKTPNKFDRYYDQKIKTISIPGPSNLKKMLEFKGKNKDFILTRRKVDELDRLKPEGWWRSYIALIVDERRLYYTNPRYIKALRDIGLIIGKDVLDGR